jgi:hypothetical protein
VFRTQSFIVEILSFSGTVGEFFCTRQSIVHVKDVLKEDRVIWAMGITSHLPEMEVRVFD